MFKPLFILFCCIYSTTLLSEIKFISSQSNNTLIELYSSQGCSSCPPAERWISKYFDHPGLWKSVFPVVFHVDYWDYLGWKDPFSQSKFSHRQRQYHQNRAIRTVYTPAVIVNGIEYRQWYRNKFIKSEHQTTGNLMVSLYEDKLVASYSEKIPSTLNIAILAMRVHTQVESGENANKTFTEDFIVLDFMTLPSDKSEWEFSFNVPESYKTNRLALVSWVSNQDSLQPLQVTGGWLE